MRHTGSSIGVFGACAVAVLARPAPATACSHPFACFPQVVYPTSADVPTNAQIVVQVQPGACLDSSVELHRVSDGAIVATTAERTLALVDTSIVDDYVVTDGLRLTPTVELDPGASYEIWASDSSGTLPPDHSIGSFTTAPGPYTADPPPAPTATITAGTPSPDLCSEAALCCGPTTLQVLDLAASNPDLLYTITTDDGSVIASDLPATSTGVAVCAGNSYVEPAGGDRLWIVHAAGDVTFHITGRDVLGRAAPEVIQTVTLCSSAGPPPDAPPGDDAGGGGGGGGGCSAGGAPGAALIGLVLAALARRRNRRR